MSYTLHPAIIDLAMQTLEEFDIEYRQINATTIESDDPEAQDIIDYVTNV